MDEQSPGASFFLDESFGFCARDWIQLGNHHLGPQAGQGAGHLTANIATGAGDDGHLAGEGLRGQSAARDEILD